MDELINSMQQISGRQEQTTFAYGGDRARA
jgi:hypothetical protein